jgi:hypothetical protein
MKKNVGKTDTILRIAAALVIGLLYITGVISGSIAIILGLFGIIFIITSMTGFCPLYTICKVSTKKITKSI